MTLKVSFNKAYYLPPKSHINQYAVNELTNQLSSLLIILPGFNDHNILFGNTNTNSHGQQIEKLLSDHFLYLLNNGEPVYFHDPTHVYHTIDLATMLPFVYLFIGTDMQNSNYYPLFISFINSSNVSDSFNPPHYILSAAN